MGRSRRDEAPASSSSAGTGPFSLATPDVTPAQVLAVLSSLVGLLVSQGLVSSELGKLIGGIASIVIPFVWLVVDALIRRARAHALAELARAASIREHR